MIQKSFQSKRPVPVYQPPAHNYGTPWYSPKEIALATARKITPAEYVRRDNIIKELYGKCTFDTGDIMFPDDPKGYAEYGPVLIIGVCQSYSDFAPGDKWPKNDNPMIVTFCPVSNKSQHVFCTVNYLTDKNPIVESC